MRPVYSRTGCLNCKQRKRKCDETKPSCLSCLRHELPCSYAVNAAPRQARNKTKHIGVFEVLSPRENVEKLPIVRFKPGEAEVIARIPASVLRFFCPTSDNATRDTSSLMQLAISDVLVREALVACFSTILPAQRNQIGHLDRIALGSALQLVRSRISDQKMDSAKFASLLLAVQFLGLIESAGPGRMGFNPSHFVALSVIVHRLEQQDLLLKLPISRPLLILAAEAVVYHFAVASLYARDIELLKRAWQDNGVAGLLQRLLADESDWPSRSPLLGGQYELWQLSFEVVSACRRSSLEELTTSWIQLQRRRVATVRVALNVQFARGHIAGPLEQQTMSSVYDLHCIALLICLASLQSASEDRDADIVNLVREGTQSFLDMQLIPMSYSTLSWSLAVLTCANSRKASWDAYIAKIAQLRYMLDTGHMRRLEAVILQVEALCAESRLPQTPTGRDGPLPGCLSLLHQSGGPLAVPRFVDDSEDEVSSV